MHRCILGLAILGFASLSGAAEVVVKRPATVEWQLVTDQSSQDAKIREWVPSGRTAEDTNWIIVQQTFTLKKRQSARSFLESAMKAAKSACTSVKYNGPESIPLDGLESYWGRTMCAQVRGKSYGTFTEQRVVADGDRMHVVTSELHLAPTAVAGGLAFADKAAFDEFKVMADASALTARREVSLCVQEPCE